jgi:tetratricopeptide (TPR) repeat protein
VAGFREVLAVSPELIPVREKLAFVMWESGRMEEAVDQAKTVLKTKPESASRLVLARVDARFNRLPDALQHLTELVSRVPDSLEGYYLQGLCYAAQYKFKEARESFERAAGLAKSKSSFAAAVGIMDHLLGNPASAAKYLKQALDDANPAAKERIHFHLALVSLGEKRWAEAKTHFRESADFVVNLRSDELDWQKLYENAPAVGAARVSLGALLLAEKLPEAASAVFRNAQERNPSDVVALFLGANASAQRLAFDEALQRLEMVTRLQPHYWPAFYAIGEIHVSKKDYAQALPAYLRVIELDPVNLTAYLRLLSLYQANSQSDKAEALCRQLISYLPSSGAGYNELAVMLTERKGKSDEALSLASKAVRLEPENGIYRDTLGWVHHQRGEIPQALEHLRKAATLIPRNPEIRLHLGQALLKAGSTEEGLVALKEVVALSPGSIQAKEAEELLTKANPAGSAP